MKTNRLIALLTLLCLCLFPAAHAEADDWYEEISRDLALQVGELAKDEAFLRANSSHLALEAVIAPLREVDFSAEAEFSRFEIDVEAIIEAAGGMTEAGKARMRAAIPSALLSSTVVATGPTEKLAAASILIFSRSYPEPEGFSPCVCALEFDGATIYVSFARSGEGIVAAQAMPGFSSNASALIETLEEINSSFGVEG